MGVDQKIIDQWFDGSGITIDSMADTLEKKNLGKRLLYTWREILLRL